MGLLVNTYIFYADVYFVQNFIIKSVVLLLVNISQKKRMQFKLAKILIVSVIATICELFCLMTLGYSLSQILIVLIEIPVMMLFVVGRSFLFQSIVKGYLFLILINGTLEILWNNFGENGHFLGLLVLSCLIVVLGTLHFLRQKKVQKGIFEVELEHKGTKQCVRAYYDSGNCLKDPYTGKGVHIVSEQAISELVQARDMKVCIPYQSLGNETGLLDVYYIEKLLIHREKEIIELQKIPLGVTKEDLFQGKQYEMILNEEIW